MQIVQCSSSYNLVGQIDQLLFCHADCSTAIFVMQIVYSNNVAIMTILYCRVIKERKKERKKDRLFSQHSTYYTLYHGVTI
jgi:hypothetical protein